MTENNITPETAAFITEDVEDILNLLTPDPWNPVTPYDDEWDAGYLSGSGENMYDDSYIDYLNGN